MAHSSFQLEVHREAPSGCLCCEWTHGTAFQPGALRVAMAPEHLQHLLCACSCLVHPQVAVRCVIKAAAASVGMAYTQAVARCSFTYDQMAWRFSPEMRRSLSLCCTSGLEVDLGATMLSGESPGCDATVYTSPSRTSARSVKP